jgi:two-component system chemotaxis response regulator CheB
MIRVLIVDDSPTMRHLIAAVLGDDAEIEVVGQAADPLEARAAIKALNPDVITLDVEMPNMNGIEFLEKIMRLRPMPVVMVSTLTTAGADATIAALEIGAVDCIAKPSASLPESFQELAAKVKLAARSRVRPLGDAPAQPRPDPGHAFNPGSHVVAIGSSTGGVEALINVISRFPANCPPTVITQHMPAAFTKSFAARLDRLSAARVCEAEDGAPLKVGQIYLAPGGERHLEVVGHGSRRCRVQAGDLVNGHRPSVDVLFSSVAKACGDNAVGAILTGMGRDGAAGLLAMRQAGARTLGQDEASCVVYGMPKSAHQIGAVEKQLSLSAIGPEILRLSNVERGAAA